jgi:3-deoxy-D-manno-octulosonic-acid transferase
MFALYSILYSVAFVLMSPLFLMRREKYASGFRERLGNYPEFVYDGRPVIWLHAVSVGEANAARPLVDEIKRRYPRHQLVISTTTRTGQELAKKIYAEKADAVFYFPFDWKFSVQRALRNFRPSAVLLMETEIWPRFIREAKLSGARVAIVNGRLSQKSFGRYQRIRGFIRAVLADIDLALMQGGGDANRLISLGMGAAKTKVTGNLKFDSPESGGNPAVDELAERFALRGGRPVIVAASTHEPEERWILDAYCSAAGEPQGPRPRLIIAPRHPERFDGVLRLLREFKQDPGCEWNRYTVARRSAEPEAGDSDADVILLDSIGELRDIYRYADIVFVGGSLIPHGGQSVLEPAAAGAAIITGPHTHNFADAVSVFLANRALVQLEEDTRPEAIPDSIYMAIADLLEYEGKRKSLAAMRWPSWQITAERPRLR